jgi:hypothetical protein
MGLVSLFFLLAEVAVFQKSTLSVSDKDVAGSTLVALVVVSVLIIVIIKLPELAIFQKLEEMYPQLKVFTRTVAERKLSFQPLELAEHQGKGGSIGDLTVKMRHQT